MSNTYYIDTGESGDCFRPPADCSDYLVWITHCYESSVSPGARGTYSGVSQLVNMLIAEASIRGARLVAIGPHAKEAAEFVERMGYGSVPVDIIDRA